MNILVINSGSSSLKFELFKISKDLISIAEGQIDGIALPTCRFTFKSKKKNIGQKQLVKNHLEALELSLKTLLSSKIIKDYKEITAIGHRVVHGGEKFKKAEKINASVIKEIKKLCTLAPLHNPANLEGILACKKLLPRTIQIADFDTSFHQTIAEKAYRYAIPEEWYKKYQVRRYGFHGISHKYVINEAIKILKNKNAKIISCHLGNGSSICASYKGQSVDTSMGFTPLEGVMMGTRSGSIDPAIIPYLEQHLKKPAKTIVNNLNNNSGLLAVSKISSDMRDIYAATHKKNKNAILAIDLLAYQIAKYCSAYIAALNGLDAIIFTAGLGEKAFYLREKVLEYLKFMGVEVDKKQNQRCSLIISTKKSKVKVFVIKTDEEKEIANDVRKLIKK